MKWLRENRGFLLFVFAMLAARSSLADHYSVPSGSMERTLFAGDRVVVDKQAYGLRVPFTLAKITPGEAPTRGDVIVFDAPVHVPAGYVFAMGDFRGNSRDSRFFGFVRADQVYAKATRVYYRTGEGFVWKPL